jgi:hypothetical protein
MKTTRFKIWAVLALALAGGLSATAQRTRTSGSGPTVPGPNDYDKFTQFITQRNIFNPQRFAIRGVESGPIVRPPPNAPQFTLVGTMSYEKGIFAFFDGNQSNLRKVLYPAETNGIAGFTITDITLANVTLQSADKTQTVDMKIGQSMQQVGGIWRVAMGGSSRSSSGGGGGFGGDFGGRNNRDFGGSGSGAVETPAAETPGTDTSAAPSPAIEGNDVLKALMLKRQQELK